MSSKPLLSAGGKVHFFYEETDFTLEYKSAITEWVLNAFHLEKKELDELNFIFCSDDFLHKINLQYLNHDTLTDIITFPNSKKGSPISGDIFISIDRVRDNAIVFNVDLQRELLRVLIHGCLHLTGNDDKTEAQQKKMRQKEDFFIRYFHRFIASS